METIRQSSINMMFRCGEQYRRRFLENEVMPPGIAAGTGTGVHYGSKVNFEQKIMTGSDLPLPDILDATRDGFIKAFKDGIYLPKENMSEKKKILNEGLNKALRLATLYRQNVAPKIKPVRTEQKFEINLPGIKRVITGTIDYEEATTLGDFKTSGKTWSKGQIYKEIQPVMYSLAYEIKTHIRPVFIYYILTDLVSGAKVNEQVMYPDELRSAYPALIRKIQAFERVLDSGVFIPANPSSWWCDPVWCGYYQSCKYVK